MIRDVFREDILNTSEYYEKKIRKIEEERQKKISEIRNNYKKEVLF
jgi:hypothetical protein